MPQKIKTSSSSNHQEAGARRKIGRQTPAARSAAASPPPIGSWLLLGLDAGAFAAGLVSGFIAYLHRSPVRVAHVPGTSAWPAQLAVAVLTVAVLGAFWLRQRRAWRALLAPFGLAALRRLTLTVRAVGSSPSGVARVLLALPPAAMFLYCFWRAGHQVTAGLDPNSTANAWGGPGYAGALACHCLDVLVLAALAAVVLNFILLRESNSPGQAGQPATVGGWR